MNAHTSSDGCYQSWQQLVAWPIACTYRIIEAHLPRPAAAAAAAAAAAVAAAQMASLHFS
jgi:hypothetical protein